MLKEIFISLVMRHSTDELLAAGLWTTIEKAYSGKKRHYHNLLHLETLIKQLEQCKISVNDWDLLLFAVFYHDIVYNVLRSDNEEKSAAVAVKSLRLTGLSPAQTEKCRQLILATKAHAISNDPDINLFTDADLSILGQAPEIYKEYCMQVRKEYSIYPDAVYKPGRRKVLQHFLQMERIFKTDFFRERLEAQSRKNLLHEIENLR